MNFNINKTDITEFNVAEAARTIMENEDISITISDTKDVTIIETSPDSDGNIVTDDIILKKIYDLALDLSGRVTNTQIDASIKISTDEGIEYKGKSYSVSDIETVTGFMILAIAFESNPINNSDNPLLWHGGTDPFEWEALDGTYKNFQASEFIELATAIINKKNDLNKLSRKLKSNRPNLSEFNVQ